MPPQAALPKPIKLDDIYTPPDLSPEALLANTTVRAVTMEVVEVANKLQVNIDHSKELADEWKAHVGSLDAFIKSLKSAAFMKVVKYSACAFVVGTFLLKMGVLRQIPQFLGGLTSIAPPPSVIINNTTEVAKSIPKPTMDSTLQILMETPLTPLAVLTTVGGTAMLVGVIRGLLWVARKL